MNFGLERINSLLSKLENPHLRLSVIHVGGTNGKGSVTSYIDSILIKAGYKTGRYNSPHFLEPRDSIRINGVPINKESYQRVRSRIEAINSASNIGATSFELLTAVAVCCFDDEKVSIAIIEVGLGGAKDATNLFPSPLVSIITTIGMDHMEILGETIDLIAKEKAGILKPKGKAVFAPQIPAVQQILVDCAVKIKCDEFIIVNAARWIDGNARMQLEDGDFDFHVPLLGDFQLDNVATAVTAILSLRKHISEFASITYCHIKEGIRNTKWPGRLEWIDVSPVLGGSYQRMLVDGAHNIPALSALRSFIDNHFDESKPIHWIIGIKNGRDISEILRLILRSHDSVYAVTFSDVEDMSWVHPCNPDLIADSAKGIHTDMFAKSSVNLTNAIQNAITRSKDDAGITVLCGSLYLVADLYRLLKLEA
ncbi:5053_t:CDS:1 [Paraglomus occultum]|uniref:Dihydrofolate synthetase n=1 Tax=Paraglomus occultum TaxID=144539 RepID=A0A9N9CF63_9GLOM|nr:5053_t:CDS:1 [Paraglomus occultum]